MVGLRVAKTDNWSTPHAGRNPLVLEALAARPDMLPQAYIDQIDSVGMYFTLYDSLLDDIYLLSNRYSDLLLTALRLAEDDSSDLFEEYVEPLLLVADEPHYQYLLVQLYDQRGETAEAINVLNAIPTSFDLSTTQQAFHDDFAALRSTLHAWYQSEDITALDSTQINYLMTFYNKSNGTESYVRPLLWLNGAIDLLPPVYAVPESNWFSMAHPRYVVQTPVDTTRHEDESDQTLRNFPWEGKLHVFPNPAENELSVEYNIPFRFEKGILTIVNQQAQEVLKVYVSPRHRKGVVQFNLNDLPEGVYVVRMEVDGKKHDIKKLVIKHN